MEKFMFKKTDLMWSVDYDYERSECRCDAYNRGDYCRCTTIDRTWVDHVYVYDVIDKLYRKHSRTDSDIDEYCFDRICHAFKIYENDLYEVETCGGYYGEEVSGVYFVDEEKIFNAYYEILALSTDLEKIQYCLKLEYGYLIDCVVSATSADIIETFSNMIYLPQTEYFKKVDRTVIEDYKNRSLPIAVCVWDGNKHKLIDGYHRFVANNDRERVSIVVLE